MDIVVVFMRETLTQETARAGGGFAGVEGEEGTEAHGVGCTVHFWFVGGREEGGVFGGKGGGRREKVDGRGEGGRGEMLSM